MTKEIAQAISNALMKTFGETYKIYTEEVQQGSEVPCFYIACLSQSQENTMRRKYHRKQQFKVRYSPSTANKNGEIYEVVDQLYEVLEYISLSSDLLKGTNMTAEISNGELNFLINYDMHLLNVVPTEESMETLDTATIMKG